VGLTARGLYNPLLPLRGQEPVGSDLHAADSSLVVVTGANQGGKSTFLRAIGIAQMMAQCGLFVAAFETTVAPAQGVFTHFRREEDDHMVSGKLDEELARMSLIADRVMPGALLLCNESFSSTNEREAALVGGDVVLALRDAGVAVHLVTHQYELAARLREESGDGTFLRAERQDDGRRTHQIVPGDPLRTSYGLDLYDAVMSRAG
jgi:DNA mismatch repair ATPase MutS